MKDNKKIEAVIFDLSGTLVDHGSLATINTMQKIFKDINIFVSKDIIKIDMGIQKKKHIFKILNNPLVKDQWNKNYYKKYDTKDLNTLSAKFDELLVKEVQNNLNIIPNVKKIFKILKRNNIKIGITTGYPSYITNIIIKYLSKNNLFVDYHVSDDQVNKGRPYPDMCKKNQKFFKIKNSKKCVKIDDSLSGIKEGKKANMITVGLTLTGIQAGLTRKELYSMSKAKKNILIKKIKNQFYKIKTDFILENLFEFEKFLNFFLKR